MAFRVAFFGEAKQVLLLDSTRATDPGVTAARNEIRSSSYLAFLTRRSLENDEARVTASERRRRIENTTLEEVYDGWFPCRITRFAGFKTD